MGPNKLKLCRHFSFSKCSLQRTIKYVILHACWVTQTSLIFESFFMYCLVMSNGGPGTFESFICKEQRLSKYHFDCIFSLVCWFVYIIHLQCFKCLTFLCLWTRSYWSEGAAKIRWVSGVKCLSAPWILLDWALHIKTRPHEADCTRIQELILLTEMYFYTVLVVGEFLKLLLSLVIFI